MPQSQTLRPSLFSAAPAVLVLLAFAGAVAKPGWQNPDQAVHPNVLTAAEAATGWRLLFDGRSFSGWRGLGLDRVPTTHWTIKNDAIKKIPIQDVPRQADGQPATGGDLMTIETFEDFELAFDWKISPGGNSGVKYNVSEELSIKLAPNRAALGFEYQILDDDRHPDAKNGPNRTAAALYDLVAPEGKTLKPVGDWNSAKIVFRGRHGEHWLNGVKVLEFESGSRDFQARREKSKYKTIPEFAEKRGGHIVLQDHGDAVWFRNVKIRQLK